ncbi:MAG: sortase [Dehalococcoidia bacterium]|nr:sortase [Dehalococcoidia bacterium]
MTPEHAGRIPTRAAGHGLAGFALGIVAVAAGVLFAAPQAGDAPSSEAARMAESAAAVRLLLDPEATPSGGGADVAPVAFSEQPDVLFSQRHATRIVIESVGLDALVSPVGLVYRDGRLHYDVPRVEAGQYAGTAAPGDAGNTVIGGHVARRGAAGVFQGLPDVSAGDVVRVFRGDRVFRYSITEIRVVAADATDVMSPTQEATLTLITCFPDDQYAERLVVVGRLL